MKFCDPIRASLLWFIALVALTCGCGGDGSSDATTTTGGDLDGGPVDDSSRVAQYIRSTTKTKLVLEIDSVAGFEPRPAAQTSVIAQLEQIVDKPQGINAVADGILTSKGTDYAWTDAELFTLADDNFDLTVQNDSIKMHVMFLDGHSARDDQSSGVILGLAWANTHLVMFKQTIDDICGGPLTPPVIRDQLCESAEFSIWLHEAGHVLGLVNTGIPLTSDHQDSEHGAHDANDACVMYWAYEGDALVDLLRDRLIGGNNTPLAFDEACLADIAAVRNGS